MRVCCPLWFFFVTGSLASWTADVMRIGLELTWRHVCKPVPRIGVQRTDSVAVVKSGRSMRSLTFVCSLNTVTAEALGDDLRPNCD
ncbi:hypothetical protein BKA93DRAFT_146059 [Sparassis latifolia]